jgi:hypothetical protein
MTEKELINKIKQLKQIKPQEDWVVFCKRQIFKEEDKVSIISLFHSVKFASQLFNKVKPAYLVSVVLMLLVVVITGFFFFQDKPKVLVQPELVEPAPAKEIILALKDLQTEMDGAVEKLRKLKKPQQILEARNIVIPTLETARDLIVEVERTEAKEESKTLAVRVDNLENTLKERTAVVAGNLIKFLETRTLTESQQEILNQAKKDYNQGNYHQALINMMLIQQMIE